MNHRVMFIPYALAYLRTSWFWLGIWVFYYLRFTDYAGIGLIESLMIVTIFVAEIPTGAVADLFGKKWTLSISLLVSAVGQFLTAAAPNFWMLAFSIFVISIGHALYSGAFEAWVFDTLKEKKMDRHFERVVSNLNSIELISMAIAGLFSGVLYAVDPRAPFVAVGIAQTLGFGLTFFMREPKIDTFKFNLGQFLRQNVRGVAAVYSALKATWYGPIILIIGMIYVLSDEMLQSILAVEFGFTTDTIGPFFALLFIIAALASQCTPFLRKRLGESGGILVLTGLFGLIYLVTPQLTLIMGGLSLILWEMVSRNLLNFTSVYLNNHVESRTRATALSAFNMVKNVPYVLTAYTLGSLMNEVTAKGFAFYLGIGILIYLLVSILARILFIRRVVVAR